MVRVRRRRVSTGLLWLPRSALEQMREQAREHAPVEHGGMLLGWVTDGQLVVSRLVAAGPGANATRNSFVADGRWQQRELEQIYTASGRTVTYLGDWHSHPHGSRLPSRRDHETASAIAKHIDARAPGPVTVILRRGARGWRPHPYRLRDGTFQRLVLRLYQER